MISIKDSSIPFRAFLGAILSEIMGVPVERSTFDPHMDFDIIEEGEDEDPGPLSEGDLSDGSGAYRGGASSKRTATKPPLTRKRARDGDNESGLMVRPFLH